MGESVRKWTAWCGFEDGAPHLEALRRDGREARYDGYGTLYKTRAEARKFYQDVRRVNIREVFK